MILRRLWQQWFGKSRRTRAGRDRHSYRPIRFEPLEQRQLLTVNFAPVQTSFNTPASKDLLIPLTSVDSEGGAVTYSVTSNSNAANVSTSFISGGTTVVFNVSGKDGSNNDFTGNITVRLFDSLTPTTVNRIRELISQHFYNGLTFHRILPLAAGNQAKIAQAGDPMGTGSGGPGTQIDDEFNTNSTFNSPGLLAMAKSNDDTNGSQLFFVNADSGLSNSPQHLNFNHTILGQVVAGFDVLSKVMATPANGSGLPNSPMRINFVREATDTQNGILRVDPGASFTGSTSITVLATGSNGQTSSQTFNINIVSDASTNDNPFLNALPAPFVNNVIATPANTPVSFTLSATDLENDSLTFQIVDASTFAAPANVQVQVNGGQVTLTPTNGFTGTIRLRAEVSDRGFQAPFSPGRDGGLDAQEFTLVVGNVPSVSLSFEQSTIAESGGATNLVATLSGTSSQAVTLELGFGGTAILNAGGFPANAQRDYSAPLTIVIPAGQLTASIPVNLVNDSLDEADETAVVKILTASNATAATNSASLTIQDDDATPTASLSVSPGSISENGGQTTVTATLSASSGQDVIVNLSLAGSATQNSDYTATAMQIVIPAGQTAGTTTIRALEDSLSDNDETIVVRLAAGSTYAIGAQSSASTTILDNDLGVSLNLLSTNIGENGGTAIVQVLLDQTFSADVTVPLTIGGSASPSDFAFSPAGTTITIPAGSTVAQFTINAPDDSLHEPTETVILSLGTPSTGTVNSAASTSTVTVIDNDPLGVSLSVSTTSITENGGTATVLATLSEASQNDVVVTISLGGAASASDYSLSATTISIPAGQVTGSVTMTATEDTLAEGNESVVINFASATGGYVASQGGESASLTITDNEATPQVSISSSGTSLSETGGTVTIVARSNIVSANDILVPISFAGTATIGSDYSASSTSIRIAAGQTSGSITISAVNDTVVEADETITLNVGTITNGTQSGSFASTISIASEDTHRVTMSISQTTIAENGGATTVSATLDSVAAQTVTIPINLTSGTATVGTDVSASSTSIVIAAGQSTGSVVIRGIDDNLFEANETFTVTLGTISGATLNGSFSQTVTVTSEDISLGAPDLDAASDDGASSTDNYTSDSTPSITIAASSGQTLNIRVNGVSVGNATDNGNNTYRFTLPDNKLNVGSNTITAHSSTTSSSLTITYAPKFDEGYRVGGTNGAARNVSFNFNARQALYRSEVGVYVADDSTGRVGNLSPGDDGYAQAALQRASTLFIKGVAIGANQVISLTGGQVLGFYLVQSGTKAEALALNPTNRGPGLLGIGGPVTFFSFDDANPDGVRHVQVVGDPISGHAEYRWEDLYGGGDLDYNDFVFSVNLAGSGVLPTMETLRVPAASTATASATFTLHAGQTSPNTPAGFTNLNGEFGIFKITNGAGTVNNLAPGSAGWLAAALATANRTTIFSASDVDGAVKSLNLTGNDQFGFYRIKGGTATQLLSQNPNNSSTGSIYALVSFDSANPDDADHFRWYGPENLNQGITGQGAADDEMRLHIMDALFGDDSDFDAFTVSIDF